MQIILFSEQTKCNLFLYSVAIIVPYRDRKEHLDIFLYHLHPILQRQVRQYCIVEFKHPNHQIHYT
mgnify:CR=1 FL=1